jgi:hypothetical protein
MRLVISSDRYIAEFFSEDLAFTQGRCYCIDGHDPLAWQIVAEPSDRLWLLVIKYSEVISVITQE